MWRAMSTTGSDLSPAARAPHRGDAPREPWRIVAGPYEVVADDEAEEVSEFLWACRRGEDVHTMRVRITEEAWRATAVGSASRDVAEAVATRGRVVLVDAAREPRPPSLVVIEDGGVHVDP
jgi:hypothetical protein